MTDASSLNIMKNSVFLGGLRGTKEPSPLLGTFAQEFEIKPPINNSGDILVCKDPHWIMFETFDVAIESILVKIEQQL